VELANLDLTQIKDAAARGSRKGSEFLLTKAAS
jgi:hypothetical protein